MVYASRVELYKEIERLRGRPIISFVESLRRNAAGQMAQDVIPEFAKQIDQIPIDRKEIDLLVVSNGGDPTVSWRIISMLRERFEKVAILLPFNAYSAATLLALGADEIVMHPYSNLGPVDPQMTFIKRSTDPNGQGRQETIAFGAEDLRHYFDFVKKDAGITDQEQTAKAFELVTKDIGAISIGSAKRSSHLALSMGEKLLGLHMKDSSKVKLISNALSTSFYHHGYPVGRTEAKEIGLPVTEPPKELEKLLWSVWEDFEAEMQCKEPFNPLSIVLGDPNVSSQLVPIYAAMPVNLPPQVALQAYNTILGQIQLRPCTPIEVEQFIAALESVHVCCQYRANIEITAARMPDMTLKVNAVPRSQRWKCVN